MSLKTRRIEYDFFFFFKKNRGKVERVKPGLFFFFFFGFHCGSVVYSILALLPVFPAYPEHSSEPKHWECLCVSSESAARINTFLLGHGQHTFAAKL